MDSDQLSLYITDLENKLAENNFEGAFDTCLDIELLIDEVEFGINEAHGNFLCTFFLVHLLNWKLHEARHFWYRISNNVKQSERYNLFFSNIWSLLKLLWNRRISDSLIHISSVVWPDHVKTLMSSLVNFIRQSELDIIGKAYANISVEDVCSRLQIDSDTLLRVCEERNWQIVDEYIRPVTSKATTASTAAFGPWSKENSIEELTAIVTQLETRKLTLEPLINRSGSTKQAGPEIENPADNIETR